MDRPKYGHLACREDSSRDAGYRGRGTGGTSREIQEGRLAICAPHSTLDSDRQTDGKHNPVQQNCQKQYTLPWMHTWRSFTKYKRSNAAHHQTRERAVCYVKDRMNLLIFCIWCYLYLALDDAQGVPRRAYLHTSLGAPALTEQLVNIASCWAWWVEKVLYFVNFTTRLDVGNEVFRHGRFRRKGDEIWCFLLPRFAVLIVQCHAVFV